MTKALPYWHVDAFAARPFAGNQAAVMLLEEWLPDEELLAIAEENSFSATGFFKGISDERTDYELRWFTPAGEIRLCGHATLASGHILLSKLLKRDDQVRFLTRHAGVVEVGRSDAGYELALPAIATEPGDWPEAVTLLGGKPQEVFRNDGGYAIFLFEGEEQVRSLEPDFAALAKLGNHQLICTAPGERTDVVSRVFVPGAGIDEDSVTGSAHAALTPFWSARLGRESFTAHQASARGGDLLCRLAKEPGGERAWLGGQCVTVVEGTFYLSG